MFSFLEPFKVELDRLPNQPADFFLGLAGRDATGKVRDMGRKIRAHVVDHDGVPS